MTATPTPDSSAERLKALLDAAVDAIIAIDSTGTILECNPAVERLFGHPPHELIGQPIETLMPEPYRSQHAGYIHHHETTGEKRIIGTGREVTALHRDGSTFPIHLAVSMSQANGQPLYTGIIRDLRDRKELEQELVTRSERERAELGQELHDVLAQQLTALSLMAKTLERRLEQENSGLIEAASRLVQLSQEAMQESRRLAHSMYPTELERRGLWTALSELISNQEKLWDTEIHFTRVGPDVHVAPTVARHLYRIAQEALTNAIKHGQAPRITVLMQIEPELMKLEIKDDGVGFTATDERGMGLSIMKYRTSLIGGLLQVDSTPGQGCRVSCQVPHYQQEHFHGT